MHIGAGIAVIVVGSALALATAFILRPRVSRGATDLLVALGGAVIAIGGLLVLDRHVTLVSWIIAPVLLAVMAIAHVRVLFGGSGPFRS